MDSNSTSYQEFDNCISSNRYIFSAWFTLYLLFLPLFLFVIFIFFTKWRQQHSPSSTTISHSDVFTLNMVTMELTSIVGSAVACYGYLGPDQIALHVGANTITTTSIGQMFFHSLTCIDRYLAVVHPVTYMRLKTGGANTIRNISISIAWIVIMFYSLTFSLIKQWIVFPLTAFLLSILLMPLVVFCSVLVLCVLIRPKPGDRKQVDQSKQTILYTILAILGALMLRFMVSVVNNSILYFLFWKINGCVVIMVTLWSTLPSSLVLPLLFLHRIGRLPSCSKG